VAYRIPRAGQSIADPPVGLVPEIASLLATGAFIGLGVAAAQAGAGSLVAISLAAVVAACNGLSTRQLAAYHGAHNGYEAPSLRVTPSLWFATEWMQLCGKLALAGAAALGLAGYLGAALGGSDALWHLPISLSTLGILTMVVLVGMQRSLRIDTVTGWAAIVALSLLALAGLYRAASGAVQLVPQLGPSAWVANGIAPLFEAAAIMLVAYNGTSPPRRQKTVVNNRVSASSPVPVVLTAAAIYLAVDSLGLGAVGTGGIAGATADTAAPLQAISAALAVPGLTGAVASMAAVALLGALLNLMLEASRGLQSMGQPNDVSGQSAVVNHSQSISGPAVAVTALAVAGLVLLRDVRIIWSLSAFCFLVYYALANLAALRLPVAARRYSQGVPLFGLIACFFLVCWIDATVWPAGIGLFILGLTWFLLSSRSGSQTTGQ
jgi:APA family basic amino acid/polyamine antiporter